MAGGLEPRTHPSAGSSVLCDCDRSLQVGLPEDYSSVFRCGPSVHQVPGPVIAPGSERNRTVLWTPRSLEKMGLKGLLDWNYKSSQQSLKQEQEPGGR